MLSAATDVPCPPHGYVSAANGCTCRGEMSLESYVCKTCLMMHETLRFLSCISVFVFGKRRTQAVIALPPSTETTGLSQTRLLLYFVKDITCIHFLQFNQITLTLSFLILHKSPDTLTHTHTHTHTHIYGI
ncbi:hypothetical protein XENOCAPTIV_007572 [Xenoophorus captivus]|uniref:Uncharacterized protein n=1 Tax=Xenoophorus captivus TaxID=1517983 RepID=A0ABV0RHE5_9TELE